MNVKLFLLGALSVAALFSLSMLSSSSSDSPNQEFHSFMQAHGRRYSSPQEFNYRLSIFLDNVAYNNMINAEGRSYELGVNQFSDLTFEEFASFYLMTPIENTDKLEGPETPRTAGNKDWTAEGKVTKVKNQGQCGSCWAFSTTGGLESLYAIKKGYLHEYSEQELVDCSRGYGNQGCNGGLMSYAFKYIHDKSVGTEGDYPYVAKDQACKAPTKGERVTVAGSKPLSKNDVATLVAAIGTQPVPVAIEVQRDFVNYKTGIYSNANCGTALNHGVLATGFSDDGKINFFRVKNSWGTSWGEAGYIRMAYGTGKGTCGIANSWDAIPLL